MKMHMYHHQKHDKLRSRVITNLGFILTLAIGLPFSILIIICGLFYALCVLIFKSYRK